MIINHDRVYSNEGYSLPADMWSVGIIVFALMGGRFPYKSVEPRALAEEARTTKLYFPEKPWEGISESGAFYFPSERQENDAECD
jgi:calcium/calmodulin-dependent protein kinase I